MKALLFLMNMNPLNESSVNVWGMPKYTPILSSNILMDTLLQYIWTTLLEMNTLTNFNLCYIKLCRITSHSCSGMFVRAFWWSSSFSRCSRWLVKQLFWLTASMFSSSFDERSSDLIYSFSEINEERLSDGLRCDDNFEMPSIKTKMWKYRDFIYCLGKITII